MPQAPKPQGNAYKLYSDQNYTKGQSQLPKFWSVWSVRERAAAEFHQFAADRPGHSRRQDVLVAERRRRPGAGE